MATVPAVNYDDPKIPRDQCAPAAPEQDLNNAYRLLLNANPEPMWILDAATLRFLLVNDAAVKRYGYTREEFLSMTVADIRPPEDLPTFLQHQAASTASESLLNAGIWEHRTKSGRIFLVEIRSGRVIFQGRGAELILAKDVTAEKRAKAVDSVRHALAWLLAESPTDDYKQILECLCTGLEFDVGEVWLSDGEGSVSLEQLWHVPALDASLERLQPGFRVRAHPDSALARLAASGSPMWYADVNQHISEEHCAILVKAGMRCGVGFPIRTKATTHGTLLLFSHRQVQPDEYDIELLSSVISQVGQHVERNRAQRSLRQAEEAFRRLFDEAPVPYHEIDRNGIVTRVNRAECDLLGIEPAEMVGRAVWEFAAAEQREESHAAVARKLAGEQPVRRFERKYRGRNGTNVDLEVSENLITDNEGRVTGIRSAMVDLSSRKRAQRRIEYQARLLDGVDDAVFGLDAEFRVTYMNRAAVEQFGWDPDEALGQDLATVAPAEVDQQTRNRYHQDAVSRGHWKGELVYHTRKRKTMTAEASVAVHYGPDGSPQGAVLVLRDISERKRAEEALRASEARLKLVQSAAGVGTFDLNFADRTLQCSETWFALYGLPPGAGMTFSKWTECIHPDDRDRMVGGHPQLLESGELSNQFRVVWPDGSIRCLLSKGRVLRDEHKRPLHLVGVNVDITDHKLVEDRLRMLSMAVEQSPVSIVITDLQGNIEYINPKTAQVTGYSLEELKGKNPRIFKSGETPPKEYRHIWRTIPYGEWQGIFHNRKKNGDLFWEAATICPIRDAQGKPTHYLAVKEDITAQREMEEALRISEERFRIAAGNTADLIYDLDLRSNTAEAFGAIERCLGGESGAEPTAYDDFQRLLHPDDREPVIGSIGEHIASGEPFHAEYRVVLGNGKVRHWRDHGQSLRDENGKPYRWIGVINDITEQKLAERANAELATIVEGADAAIISKDLAGNILTWNPGAERIYGYPAAEMLGRNMSVLVPDDRIQEQDRIQSELAAGKQVHHLETVRVKRGGARIDVLITVSPIRDIGGRIVGASVIAWDITEFKHLQRQLAQSQKLESIGQLAAGIAHEINTPIQYIGDNATFLEEAFGDLFRVVDAAADPDSRPEILLEADVKYLKEEIPKSIHELLDGVNHVARIVRAMKEFSHPGPVEKMPADLNRGIESTILVSKNEWKYVADVVTELDPELPPVECVAGELNQVVLNLIINAAHAIAGANPGAARKGTITIATRHDDRFAEIRVSDTGTGIPEEIRSRIFDPFFTTKEIGKGTGQGLSIAHTVIAQTHRGTIHFETEMGVGTTFIIRLPLAAEESAK